MIARLWRGATRQEVADQYLDCLRETGLTDYAATEGHRGTIALRRQVDGRAEFLLITLWDSMDAIQRFAGAEPERAVFYDEVDHHLVERDERATHFEVVHRDPGPS
jgi:heme-degrading monooxygenase HmoA